MSKNALYVVIVDLKKKIVVLEIIQYVENMVSLATVDVMGKFVSLESFDSLESLVYHHIAHCFDFFLYDFSKVDFLIICFATKSTILSTILVPIFSMKF